ncbi:MAG TPA: DUF2059 domain-containing protein [Gemmatimonadaceae bacterium]|nr:DUF2059 domain-containing protein [Gemmatimonadaceae bacterium]
MRTLRTLLSLALLLGASAAPAAAQAPAAVPPAAAPGAAQLAAARELLQLVNLDRTLKGSAEMMIQAQLAANPMLEPYGDVLRQWAGKYLTLEAMGDRMAAAYAGTFTEAELRELVKFYRSPVGRKLAEQTPVLAQKGQEIGAAVAQEHQAELLAMIQERTKELEAQQEKPE